MRWWREFWQPALKCERVGHSWRTEWRRGFVRPERSWPRAVADEVVQERGICRCGLTSGDWATVSRSGIQSLSGPREMFDEIERGGSWREYGTRPKDPSQ